MLKILFGLSFSLFFIALNFIFNSQIALSEEKLKPLAIIGNEEIEVAENEIMWIPSSSTAECTDIPEIGKKGSSKENPIKISIKKLLKKSQKMNCKWVEVSGFFRWDNFYSHVAALYPSKIKYYKLSPTFERRNNIIWLESFLSSQEIKIEFQNSSLKVIGLFYDLCHQLQINIQNLPEYKEGEMIWLFGPCHYSGMAVLKNIIIKEKLSPPFQYLTDENSREKFGNLIPFKEEFGNLEEIRKNSLDFLTQLKAGNFEAYLESFGISGEEDISSHEYQIPIFKMYFINEKSALEMLQVPFEELENKIYVRGDRGENGLEYDGEDIAISCFCLDGSCEGKWPISSSDADAPSSNFICVGLDKVEKENDEVYWTWRDIY